MTKEARIREDIVIVAKSLFERGYTHGSTGNISVPFEDGLIVTPTGTSFGALDPARLSRLGPDGRLISGDEPTKETVLHRAVYAARPSAGAVIHLHGTHSVALSCLPVENPNNALPKLTAYSHMQCGNVAMLPFFRPGDAALAEAVRQTSETHWSILLAHHGPVVAGTNLRNAMYATEELEQTARLALMLRGCNANTLSDEQVADLDHYFPPWRI
jgi:ribulose-5-phosphate 4-epimerase/fuculose-1-phosphate aldolase